MKRVHALGRHFRVFVHCCYNQSGFRKAWHLQHQLTTAGRLGSHSSRDLEISEIQRMIIKP